MPNISIQMKPIRVQTMEEMKNEKDEFRVFFRKRELERAETGEVQIG